VERRANDANVLQQHAADVILPQYQAQIQQGGVTSTRMCWNRRRKISQLTCRGPPTTPLVDKLENAVFAIHGAEPALAPFHG